MTAMVEFAKNGFIVSLPGLGNARETRVAMTAAQLTEILDEAHKASLSRAEPIRAPQPRRRGLISQILGSVPPEVLSALLQALVSQSSETPIAQEAPTAPAVESEPGIDTIKRFLAGMASAIASCESAPLFAAKFVEQWGELARAFSRHETVESAIAELSEIKALPGLESCAEILSNLMEKFSGDGKAWAAELLAALKVLVKNADLMSALGPVPILFRHGDPMPGDPRWHPGAFNGRIASPKPRFDRAESKPKFGA